MKVLESSEDEVTLAFDDASNTQFVLKKINLPIIHGTGFGRLALGIPAKELPAIESLMKEKNYQILTPLVSLDTPGKATVQVVIMADPVRTQCSLSGFIINNDEYEYCMGNQISVSTNPKTSLIIFRTVMRLRLLEMRPSVSSHKSIPTRQNCWKTLLPQTKRISGNHDEQSGSRSLKISNRKLKLPT
jgi:hypothetical protein